MFKKLKNKIEAQNNPDLDEAIDSRTRTRSESGHQQEEDRREDEEGREEEDETPSDEPLEERRVEGHEHDGTRSEVEDTTGHGSGERDKEAMKEMEALLRSTQQTAERLKKDKDSLRREVDDLKDQLMEYNRTQKEKDQLLLRNAELSNLVEKLKKDLKEEREEREEVQTELDSLKTKKVQNDLQNNNQSGKEWPAIKELKETVAKLEESLADKNKTIRLQQQRISDIKKSIQKGDWVGLQGQSGAKAPGRDGGHGYWSDSCNDLNHLASSSTDNSPKMTPKRLQNKKPQDSLGSPRLPMSLEANETEINFQYLKNVVFKFITSSEHEAQRHLIKAISVLLSFSSEEEQMVRETVEWRASWLASLPLVGNNLRPSLSHTTGASSSLLATSGQKQRSSSKSHAAPASNPATSR